MWVKKQPAEIRKSKEFARKKRWSNSIMLGIVVGVMVTFSYGYFGHNGALFVPLDEIERRLPRALTFGFISTLLCYWFVFGKKMVVCPKCGYVKTQDNSMKCSCGGVYADLDEYKWQ